MNLVQSYRAGAKSFKTPSEVRTTSGSLAYLGEVSTSFSHVCLSKLLGLALSSDEGGPKTSVSIALVE
jgi:hypothetical protein